MAYLNIKQALALDILDDSISINSTRDSIRENIKISSKESVGYYELKKHKPRFDEGYSKLSDQRTQTRLQWLGLPSQINGDNLNNERSEANGHFMNKKREYLKYKINELPINSKNKTIIEFYTGIN
jgi:hypothetical protein